LYARKGYKYTWKELKKLMNSTPDIQEGSPVILREINFVPRFVPDYASIVKPINLLLKKEQRFKWTTDTQEAFNNIKGAIAIAPILISPDFQRDFIIYSFATEAIVASVLTQKNNNGEDLSISFMRKNVHDYELRYLELEKQVLALVKFVAHFWTYILNSHAISYVPSSLVKMLLNQLLKKRFIQDYCEWGLGRWDDFNLRRGTIS
jgi:hypothetical protein